MSALVATLLRFVLASATLLSSGARALPEAFARAIAESAAAEPVGNARVTAAYLVALAWAEGANDPRAKGDGGHSYCALQIYLPNGARTAEGWSGQELLDEPDKCVRAGLRILRYSVTRGPESCPLCLYARGPRGLTDHHAEAQRLNDYRVGLARRALNAFPKEPDE